MNQTVLFLPLEKGWSPAARKAAAAARAAGGGAIRVLKAKASGQGNLFSQGAAKPKAGGGSGGMRVRPKGKEGPSNPEAYSRRKIRLGEKLSAHESERALVRREAVKKAGGSETAQYRASAGPQKKIVGWRLQQKGKQERKDQQAAKREGARLTSGRKARASDAEGYAKRKVSVLTRLEAHRKERGVKRAEAVRKKGGSEGAQYEARFRGGDWKVGNALWEARGERKMQEKNKRQAKGDSNAAAKMANRATAPAELKNESGRRAGYNIEKVRATKAGSITRVQLGTGYGEVKVRTPKKGNGVWTASLPGGLKVNSQNGNKLTFNARKQINRLQMAGLYKDGKPARPAGMSWGTWRGHAKAMAKLSQNNAYGYAVKHKLPAKGRWG